MNNFSVSNEEDLCNFKVNEKFIKKAEHNRLLGEFPELLEAGFDQSNYYVCQINREYGAVRILAINQENDNLEGEATVHYTLNIPSNEKIIKTLYNRLNRI